MGSAITLESLLSDAKSSAGIHRFDAPAFLGNASAKAIRDWPDREAAVTAVFAVIGGIAVTIQKEPGDEFKWYNMHHHESGAQNLFHLGGELLKKRTTFGTTTWQSVLEHTAAYEVLHYDKRYGIGQSFLVPLASRLEELASDGTLDVGLAPHIRRVQERLERERSSTNIALARRFQEVADVLQSTPAVEVTSGKRELTPVEHTLLNIEDASMQLEDKVGMLAREMTAPAADAIDGAVHFTASRAGTEEHIVSIINSVLASALPRYIRHNESAPTYEECWQAICRIDSDVGLAVLSEVHACIWTRPIEFSFERPASMRYSNGVDALWSLMEGVLETKERVSPGVLARFCDAMSRTKSVEYKSINWKCLVQHTTKFLMTLGEAAMVPDVLVPVLRLRERVARSEDAGFRGVIADLDKTLDIAQDFPLILGERWTNQAFVDWAAMSPKRRAAVKALLSHCAQATGTSPTGKWSKETDKLIKGLGEECVHEHLVSWFSLVGKPRPKPPGEKVQGRDSSVPLEPSADVLRGMVFVAARYDRTSMARAIGDLAMACFKMVPGVGARCIKPGTSAVWALSQMKSPEALAQLSRVRQLVKFGTAKKVVDKAITRIARDLGLTADSLQEIAVPDFGLSVSGELTESAGEFTVRLRVNGTRAAVEVVDAEGRIRPSPPAAFRKEHGPVLKALRQTAADIETMLAAQAARIERLYHTQRQWELEAWKSRYLDHPLVGLLARRLIWWFETDGKVVSALWRDGNFVDATGSEVHTRSSSIVRLWHPALDTAAHVLAWRRAFEQGTVAQPFKQAHREVYLLTDAERHTEIYSNRFAAHIVRQAQLNALCQQQAWRYKLFVLEYGEPPELQVPEFGLSARFVVSSTGEDTYGNAGASTYLETDRVLFVSEREAGGVPLREVPPLIFSEAMRDVDLFVGVCSVGNNPEWQDGGPNAAFRDYWHSYSFGDLTETGKNRHDLLSRLIPRLEIAPRCELKDKYLHVKGTLRTYKIHLGSGNILMEPNDQYLCIVPGSFSDRAAAGHDVFLPFEGDRTLAIILSKAFLLAADDQITDTTITRQITRQA